MEGDDGMNVLLFITYGMKLPLEKDSLFFDSK